MKVSIITPWHGETGQALAGDYYRAVEGSAQIIIVDNACPPATASILSEMTAHLAGEYVRAETNLGFAGGNNQGYSKATGDIIVFLNSDVAPTGPWLAQVAKDVRDGALYGPSLAAQLVAGRQIPYLEGWCIAATRATWERIKYYGYAEQKDFAIWDADAYPGPYWEDNDLCLRALAAGIELRHTAWSIAHKGGQTAGPIIRHAESFARNEHTFTERALAVLRAPSFSDTWHRYMAAYHTPSDISHHIGLLYSLAHGNVVELGTRTGVSTAALLAGVEARGGHVWSVDIEDCGALFQHEQWTFTQGDSRNPELPYMLFGEQRSPDLVIGQPCIDLLLIDTEHTYEQCSAELALWSEWMRPGGRIALHDPETFPGVRRAIVEFCEARGWNVTFVLPNNGMAVVEVPRQTDGDSFAGGLREPWDDGIGNML